MLEYETRAVAQLTITDLCAQYAWAFDRGDLDALIALFTPEAVFDGARGVFQGTAALSELFASSFESQLPGGLAHFVTNSHVLEATHDDFIARSRHLAVAIGHGERRIISVGSYTDRCVRLDEGWFFASRHLTWS
jgi:ketosteroid isomerase-like protein